MRNDVMLISILIKKYFHIPIFKKISVMIPISLKMCGYLHWQEIHQNACDF